MKIIFTLFYTVFEQFLFIMIILRYNSNAWDSIWVCYH
jgi:hypothetical protein